MVSELDASRVAEAIAALPDQPTEAGRVVTVVARPTEGERHVVDVGRLDTDVGLVGDGWSMRPTRTGRPPERERMLTIANADVALALADGDADRALGFGDQLLVELDLSAANLPAGTRLRVGGATVEVSAAPHLGCVKFRDRFGRAALKAVNTDEGRAARLRGLNAVVLEAGRVRPGDPIAVLARPDVGAAAAAVSPSER